MVHFFKKDNKPTSENDTLIANEEEFLVTLNVLNICEGVHDNIPMKASMSTYGELKEKIVSTISNFYGTKIVICRIFEDNPLEQVKDDAFITPNDFINVDFRTEKDFKRYFTFI